MEIISICGKNFNFCKIEEGLLVGGASKEREYPF